MQTIGPYQLLEELGRSHFGTVFRARHRELGREVAVKVLERRAEDDEDRIRFLREARLAASLDHPGIVTIHDLGEDEGILYIAMELMQGGSLDDHLPVAADDLRRYVRWMAKVAEALGEAHRAGILHRDVKPGNILLDRQGEPKLADFGLARRLSGGRQLTEDGTTLGTPAYSAPEQVSGRRTAIGVHSDIYSVGATLYHLVTGQPPYEAEAPWRIAWKVLHEEPAPPRQLAPSCPPSLEAVILKAMARSPRYRYASAADLAADLRRFLAGDPVSARRPGMVASLESWTRRRPGEAFALVVGALVLIFGAVVWSLPKGDTKTSNTADTSAVGRSTPAPSDSPPDTAPEPDEEPPPVEERTQEQEQDPDDGAGAGDEPLSPDLTDPRVPPADPASFDPPFGKDSPFNQPIPADARTDSQSDAMIALFEKNYRQQGGFWLQIREAPPVYYATGDTPRRNVPLSAPWLTEGWDLLVAAPLPDYARPDPSGEGQLVIVDPRGQVFEFWQARHTPDGWQASWGNRLPLAGSGVYPNGASCRGSGFALLAGTIWPQELARGRIEHALVFGYAYGRAGGPVPPATESNGWYEGSAGIPQGGRLQLDPELDLAALGLEGWELTVTRAMQEYGMINGEDNGEGSPPSLYFINPWSFAGNPYEGLLPGDGRDGLFLGRLPADRFRVIEMEPQDPDPKIRLADPASHR